MSTDPMAMFLFDDMPPALRRRGSTVVGLILGPRSSVRRFMGRAREGAEDIAACFSESRPIDQRRDAYVLNARRNAIVGTTKAVVNGCTCGERFGAIAQDLGDALTLDAQVDPLVWGTGWPIAKQLAGYLNRALLARRTASRATGKGAR